MCVMCVFSDYNFTVREPCSPEGAIRLAEEFYFSDAVHRLEVCIGGHWGSVCGDGENDNSIARVACGELHHAADGMYIYWWYFRNAQ